MPPVRCIKPFGRSVPGDLADLPAGAAFDTEHWENVGAAPGGERQSAAGRAPAPAGADGGQPSLAPASAVIPKEGA